MRSIFRSLTFLLVSMGLLASIVVGVAGAQLQVAPAGAPATSSELTDPGYDADVQTLFELERRFAADVKKGGGPAFAAWFAEDAVTLNNGKAAVQGKGAIGGLTHWTPEEYQLTWTPEGGRIGPSRDMGFTWGSYQGRSKDKQGNPVTISGRYMTVWRKDSSGQWKVLLDASNDAPPEAGACCSVR